MGLPVNRTVVMDKGAAGSKPARFNFLINFLCFQSAGWWLFNKKFQIIVISLPQDSLIFVSLCLTPKTCVEHVAKLVEQCSQVMFRRDQVRN